MGRGLTTLLLLSFLLPIGAAETVTITEQWVQYEDTIDVEGEEYTVSQSRENDAFQTAIFRINGSGAVTRLGDCKEFKEYSFCYDRKSFDTEMNIDDEGVLRPGMFVKVIRDEDQQEAYNDPAFSINIEKNATALTDANKAVLRVKNTGEPPLVNFSGRIRTPDFIEITPEQEDVVMIGNDIIVSDQLLSGQNLTMPFEYAFKQPIETNFTFEYSYYHRNETREGSKVVYIEPQVPYTIDVDVPDQANLYETTSITLTVETDVDGKTVSLQDTSVALNKNHQLEEASDFNFGPERSWHAPSLEIEKNTSKTYEFEFIPRYTGQTNITVKTDIGVESFTLPFNQTVDITVPEPTLNKTINISSKTTIGEDIPINVSVHNPSDYTLYGIRIRATSELGEILFRKNNLTVDETYDFTTNISTEGRDTKSYPITFETSYRTPTRELLRADDIEYAVQVQKPLYGMYLFYDEVNPQVNDTVDITLRIENIGRNNLENITVNHSKGVQNISVPSGKTLIVNTTSVTYQGSPIRYRAEATHPNISDDTRYILGGEEADIGEEDVKVVQPESESAQEEPEEEGQEEPPQNSSDDNAGAEGNQSAPVQEPEQTENAIITLLKSLDAFFAETFGAS